MFASDEEIARMADHLGLPEVAYREQSTRVLSSGHSVLAQTPDGACAMLDAQGACRVHPVRPRQCATYPFWRSVLASPETWQREAECCPGIGRSRRIEADRIAALRDDDGLP